MSQLSVPGAFCAAAGIGHSSDHTHAAQRSVFLLQSSLGVAGESTIAEFGQRKSTRPVRRQKGLMRFRKKPEVGKV